MRKEKTWNMIGMLLGIVVILTGIVFIVTPAGQHTTSSVGKYTFGGDYYTEEYAATRVAALNAAAAANNIGEIGEKIAIYVGAFFIVMGVLVLITYGKKYFCENGKLQGVSLHKTEAKEYEETSEDG